MAVNNEWDELRHVIVGDATDANWPQYDQVFRESMLDSTWTETEFQFGPVPKHIIRSANESLKSLAMTFDDIGVEVSYVAPHDYQRTDGMYGYCPRDSVLVVGDTAYVPEMTYPSRRDEWKQVSEFFSNIVHLDGAVFDAANVCRLNRDILFLVSKTGTVQGAQLLQDALGSEYHVHVLDNVYSGVHIDSTIVPLREGLVMLNATRINDDNMPEPLKSWDKIWIHENELVDQPFVGFPYASNWIGLNVLSVNPNLVICDPKQDTLRSKLNRYNVSSIGVDLIESRTLGGGHHCVTLDVTRG